MSDADPLRHPAPTGLTRRRFIRGAGATAAGAVVLGDPLLNSALGQPKKKKAHSFEKRPTCVATVSEGVVVTSDDEGRLILWTVTSENVLLQETSAAKHAGKAAFVTFSGNMKPARAFTAGYDGKIILHNVANLSDKKPPTFEGHIANNKKREAWVVAVSPNGAQAVSSTNDGQILLWNTTDPDKGPVQQFDAPHEPVGGLAWVPKTGGAPANQFLSTHVGGEARLWNVGNTKAAAHEFPHKNQPVNAVAVEKEGKFFVSGSFDMDLRMWDLINPGKNPLKVLKGHRNWVWRVALSPSGRLAASAGEDGFVHVWDLNKKGPVIRPEVSFGRFVDGVMGVTFLREDRIVFTALPSSEPRPLNVLNLNLK